MVVCTKLMVFTRVEDQGINLSSPPILEKFTEKKSVTVSSRSPVKLGILLL